MVLFFLNFVVRLPSYVMRGICYQCKETAAQARTFLFQRLSMALQQGNAVAFQNTMVTE